MIRSKNISNHITKDLDLKLFISNNISFISQNLRGLRSGKQQINWDAIIDIMEGKVSQLLDSRNMVRFYSRSSKTKQTYAKEFRKELQ